MFVRAGLQQIQITMASEAGRRVAKGFSQANKDADVALKVAAGLHMRLISSNLWRLLRLLRELSCGELSAEVPRACNCKHDTSSSANRSNKPAAAYLLFENRSADKLTRLESRLLARLSLEMKQVVASSLVAPFNLLSIQNSTPEARGRQ